MTRYATRQQVIDSLAGVFGDFAADYDLDAIIDETYAYRVDEDENGNQLLNTAGFEQIVTDEEFWAIAGRHDSSLS